MLRQSCTLLLLLAIATTTPLSAQKLGYGFKAGAGLYTILGPKETDSEGNAVESASLGFKLHAGALIRLGIAEDFGVQAELQYAQKGGRYVFDGPSYPLPQFEAVSNGLNARRRITINQNLGYLDLLVMPYYNIGKFSVALGPSASYLVSERGLGTLRYSDDDPDLTEDITFDLEYNYRKDDIESSANVNSERQTILGELYPTIVGAYYFETEKKGNVFENFDLGANLDLSYNPNGGFRIGLRTYLGLTDIGNDFYDYSKVSRNPDNSHIERNDFDRNFGTQLYFMFGF